MAFDEAGVTLIVDGLAAFEGGMNEAKGLVSSLGDTASGIGAAGMDALGGALDTVGDIVAGAFSAALAVGVAGVAALAGGIAYGITQAMEAEQSVNDLNRVIRNLGDEAPITSQGALDLADQFAYLAGGSDDAVLSIIDLGLKARTISESEFPAFIQASLDLGAVMGDNARASKLLAMAQDDPLAAYKQIERATGAYSTELETQIKALQDSGDTAGALALVMGELATTTGGAALENTQTLSGMIELFKGTLSEAAEEVGAAFLPMLHAIGDVITTNVLPIVTSLAENFAAFIATGNLENIDNVMSLIAEAFGLFGFNARDVEGVLFTLSAAFGSLVEFITTNIPAVQAMLEAVFVAIGPAMTALGTVITTVLVPALQAAFTEIFGQGPTAQEIVTGLLNAIVLGAQMVADWVVNVLVPAVETFSDWIVNDFTPQAVLVRDWLQTNIPIAAQALADFWTNTLVPAINQLVTFWNTSLLPTLVLLQTWLATNIPLAITAVTNFWNNTLMPAVQATVDYWNNNLLPAITAIHSFFVANVVPVLVALGAAFTEVARITSEVFVAVWNSVLLPALTALYTYIFTNVNPILNGLGQLFTNTLTPAFNAFRTEVIDAMIGAFTSLAQALHDVKSWLDDVAAALANIHIPGDLTPGSPTPFEIGLRGAADAAKLLSDELRALETKAFSASVNASINDTMGNLERLVPLPDIARRAAVAVPGGSSTTVDNRRSVNVNAIYNNVSNPPSPFDDASLAMSLM